MFEYTDEDGSALLKLARDSIQEEFAGNKPEIPEGKQFRQARGVFVTLHEKGKLRGCIGFPYPSLPITKAITEAAKAAAFSDPRFSPLKEKELEKVKIEISILTHPVEISAVLKNIETRKDGLMCEYMGYSGLLLPQVAVEYNLDSLRFLEEVCSKAGLPNDAWQRQGFKLQKFQCQIFKEKA